MAGSFLRLEIDESGISAMIVEQGYKKLTIQDDIHVRFEDLPETEEKDTDTDPFDAGMNMVARNLDLEACTTAVIFVSPRTVYFRNMDLPFGTEKKIKQILPFELETLLPVMNEAYISDFHLLEGVNDANLILSASILESAVEKYFSTLAGFGIKPLVIAPGGYAAAIGFLNDREDISTFAFVHIAAAEVTLVLVNNRTPCYVRSFPAFSLVPEDLAISVKQTIIGFNQRTGADLSFDIFIGSDEDSSKTEDVYHALEKTLAYQSRLRSVEQGLQKTLIQEKINSKALLDTISPDLTVKYLFNFCTGKYGTSSFLKRYFSNIAASVVLFLCVLSVSMITAGFENSNLDKKITGIDNTARSIFMATFPDKKKVQDPYLQMKANVQAALKNSETAGNKNPSDKTRDVKVVAVMGEVSRKIPSTVDMEISRFLFNNGRLVLSGSTENFNNVDTIKSKIESSDLFEKVSISSAAADKKGDRVNFKFIIEM